MSGSLPNYKSGDTQTRSEKITWHTNESALTCLTKNRGNCGGTANVVNYVLVGDYDEVGFVQFSEIEGGHVYINSD